ncbi:hypothetical protein N2152v2_001403 [Parachlorella kessleri]
MTLRTHPRGSDSVLQDLWQSKAWRLFPFLLVYITGVTLLVPFVPTLMTNYFASNRAGRALHCEDYPRDKGPVECDDAHGDVVLWSSWTSFASNAVVSVLLLPMLGHWSDLHGRRPFFLLALALAFIPLGVVLMHIMTDFPLKWYYLVQVLTSSVSSITPALSFLADLLAPQHRAAAFGLIMAAFSLGVFIGPAVGAQMTPESAALAAIGTVIVCLAYVAVALPESVTPEAKEQARQRLAEARAARATAAGSAPGSGVAGGSGGVFAGSGRALKILMRSSLFKKLTVCMMLSGTVSEGIQDLLIQYLQLKMAFGVKDQAKIFMTFGACGLLVQSFVLRSLLAWFGEQRVLCLGIGANLVQMVVLALATAKWQAFGAIALGSLGSVSFPTISSIKANNAQEHEQGSVQGALYGARALASGVGPLLFAALFKAFTSSESKLPYFPGAPFILGATLMLAALAVAATIPANAGGSAGAVRQLSWRRLNTFRSVPTDDPMPGLGGREGDQEGAGLQRGLLAERPASAASTYEEESRGAAKGAGEGGESWGEGKQGEQQEGRNGSVDKSRSEL